MTPFKKSFLSSLEARRAKEKRTHLHKKEQFLMGRNLPPGLLFRLAQLVPRSLSSLPSTWHTVIIDTNWNLSNSEGEGESVLRESLQAFGFAEVIMGWCKGGRGVSWLKRIPSVTPSQTQLSLRPASWLRMNRERWSVVFTTLIAMWLRLRSFPSPYGNICHPRMTSS